MADNTTLNLGTGGDDIRTEEKAALAAKVPVTLIDVAGTANAEAIIGDSGVFMPVEGAAAHDAAAAGNPLLIGAEFDDTTPDAVDEGDVGRLRVSSRRELYVQLRDAAGNERGMNVDASGNIGINDGGNVLSVDWNGTAPPIGAGVEATALRVTVATDSTGVLSVDDNGGSLTVDNAGTFAVQVNAALPAGDNNIGNVDIVSIPAPLNVTGSGTEAAALRVTVANDSSGVLSVDDGGGNLSVDWAGTVPPIGAGTEAAALRVTMATDSTGVLSIDDNGGSLTVDNGGTFAVQVDAALPAGDNNIGNVDIVSHVPGTGATNLGKAIDSASGATDTGVAILAIRDDSLSALTPIEGDYVPLRVNSTGALHVTGGGGGTQYNVDDVAGGTDTGTLLLAVRDDALTTLTPADGDYVQLRTNSTGALHVTGGGGGTEYVVDDAAPATPTGTASLMERDDALGGLTPIEGDWSHMFCDVNGALWVAVGAALPAGDNNIGNVDVVSVPAPLNVTGGGTEAAALRVTIASDSTGVISVDDNGANLSIDWAGTVPPIGAGTEAAALRVTMATDSTGVLSVDDNGGSLTVDNGGTFAVQVDAALPTGDNNIGNVDVVSQIPGTGATNLGKAIDSTSGATDTGVAMLAIRDDSLSALTPIEGDYVPLRVNSTGALHVTGGGGGTQYNVDDVAGATDTGTALLAVRDDVLGTLTPADGDYVRLRTNSQGALHVTGGGGGTEYVVDDAAPATPTGTASLMERDDALGGLTPIEGDWSHMFCDANGALWVAVGSSLPAGTNNIGDVDVLSLVPGTGSTNLGKAIDSGAGATDTGVAVLAVRDDTLAPLVPAENDYVTLRVGSTGALWTTVSGTVAVSHAGLTDLEAAINSSRMDVTFPTETHQEDFDTGAGTDNTLAFGIALPASGGAVVCPGTSAGGLQVDLGSNNDVQGVIAHGQAVSGNPMLLGAEGRTGQGSAVDSGDVVRLLADIVGKQVVSPYTLSDDLQDGQTTHTDTTNQQLFSAKAAGVRNYLLDISISNTSSTDTEVIIKNGTTEIWRIAAPAGGGAVHSFAAPLRGSPATAMQIATADAVSTVRVSGSGYQGR